MTIDEEIANTDANCPAHCNISCDKCVQESKQLAEWLEELKILREEKSEFQIIAKDIAEYNYEMGMENGYNKAIDDFAENISLKISESIIWGMLVNSHKDNSFNDTSDKIVDYVINTANEIAEQLKVGESE